MRYERRLWARQREVGACDTLHRALMRGREPKEPGNEIRSNSIQLLLNHHGWRFRTHPVEIRFTDVEERRGSRSAAVRHTATTSHSQQLWFISTWGVIRLCWDLKADPAMFWYRFDGKCRNNWVFTHHSLLCTAPQSTQLFQVCVFEIKEQLINPVLALNTPPSQSEPEDTTPSPCPHSYPPTTGAPTPVLYFWDSLSRVQSKYICLLFTLTETCVNEPEITLLWRHIKNASSDWMYGRTLCVVIRRPQMLQTKGTIIQITLSLTKSSMCFLFPCSAVSSGWQSSPLFNLDRVMLANRSSDSLCLEKEKTAFSTRCCDCMKVIHDQPWSPQATGLFVS